MSSPIELLGEPSGRHNLRVWEWLKESKIMAVGWTAMRVWFGIMWIQAGSAKLWSAEAAFLHNNGAGVAGFAAHGTPAYSWWGSFLHNFVVPNSGWIAILVAVAEFAIGMALVSGLFTRVAAIGSLALLFTSGAPRAGSGSTAWPRATASTTQARPTSAFRGRNRGRGTGGGTGGRRGERGGRRGRDRQAGPPDRQAGPPDRLDGRFLGRHPLSAQPGLRAQSAASGIGAAAAVPC